MKLYFTVYKPAPCIFSYLSNLQKFVTVHPVITKIEKESAEHYLVYETLKIGPLPFSFTYSVTTNSNAANKTVTMQATVMKCTHIHMNFLLKPSGDYTVVEETIRFSSPLPVHPFLKIIFKKQHRQLFRNIELAP